MKLDGSYTFDAPRKLVWDTMQDPEALRKSIPGVETFEQTAPNEYQAKMKIGVGAIKGSYGSKIKVFDQQEPSHYKLSIDATGRRALCAARARSSSWKTDQIRRPSTGRAMRRLVVWWLAWGSACWAAWPR